MDEIRIERNGTSALDRVRGWLMRHRGEAVRLDDTKRLALGTPITGARAVIVAATLQDEGHPGPQLGGMVRVLSNRSQSEPVRLVFEGRSPAGLERKDAEAIATEILDRISGLVGDEPPLSEVA